MAYTRSMIPGRTSSDTPQTWKEKLGDCHDVLKQITETVQSVSKQMESLETGVKRSPADLGSTLLPSGPSPLAKTMLLIGVSRVEVTVEHANIDLEKVINAVPFKEWVEKVGRNRDIVVKSVIVQSVDMFGPRVGFIKFKADIEVEGKSTPGIVFMRGGSVVILVLLKCEGQLYTLMVKQHRMPMAETFFPEIPAGMLDGDGNFSGVAAKELEEETGIVINSSELIDMTEMVYGKKYRGGTRAAEVLTNSFLYRKDVSRETLHAYQGKCTGLAEEGERIVLQVIPYEELWTSSADAKALCAICLYEKLTQAGKIPHF
eukprot:CAMPEP_0169165436 /NCGR_PEP_ID=MMETSP1015-20121227/59415_1 /TAXON_ID=342587 /ORGANISM="Karlodinium micrum, Strain CCMP2283" /LENGTH=316 /DNA_ID=CAMNT_0009238035 /DNA_START=20 /DNA_END=971 /DNA_ORIENTATION=-